MATDETILPDVPPQDIPDDEAALAESHRAYVREIDQRFGKVYGLGGGAALLAAGAVVAAGWALGAITSPAVWSVALTVALIVLFVVRRRAHRSREALRREVETYCDANGFSVDVLRRYYDANQIFPFFSALFEERPGSRSRASE